MSAATSILKPFFATSRWRSGVLAFAGAALLVVLPASAEDAGSRGAREVMHEVLEKEAAQPVPPPRLPDAAADQAEDATFRRLGALNRRAQGLTGEAALHAADAAAEGQARARAAQQAVEDKLKKAGQAAASRSQAAAAKKAAPTKPHPPRP